MSGTGAELSRKRSDPSSFAVAVYQVGDRVQCLTQTKHALGTWLPAVIGAASLAGDGTFDCDLVGSDISEMSVPVSRLRLAKRQKTKDEEEKGEGDEEEKKQEARRTAAEEAGAGTGTTVKAGADVETQGAAEEAAVRAVATGAGPEAMEVPDDAVAEAENVEGTEVHGTAESEAETGAAAETRAAEPGAAETGAAVAIKGKAGAAGAVADTVGDEPPGEDEVAGSITEQMWRRSLVPPRAAPFPLPPLPHEREATAAVVAAETAETTEIAEIAEIAEVEDNTGKEPAKGKGKRGHAAMADNAQVPNICDQQGDAPLPRPGNTKVDWALTWAGDVRVGSRVVALKSKFGFLQGAISVIVGVKKQTGTQRREKKRNPNWKIGGEWVLDGQPAGPQTRRAMGIRYVRQDDLGVAWALLPMSDEKKGDERTCSGCYSHFDQSAFSQRQWKKGVKRRCKTCVPGTQLEKGYRCFNDTVGQAPIKHHMQRRSTDAVAVAARRAALLLSEGALSPFPPTCGLESGANERRGRGGSEGGARWDATCSTAIEHRAESKKNAICPGGLNQTVRPNPPLLGPPETYLPAPVRAICQAVRGSAARSGKRPSPASGFAPTYAWKKGDVGAYVERHPWWADDDLVFALQAAREQKTAVPGDVLKAVVEKLCTTGRIGGRFVL